jgi:predicted ester cyclase
MALEENKKLGRRLFEEAWNRGDFAVIDQVISPRYLPHDPLMPGITGIVGMKHYISTYRTAFPHLRFTIEAQIAEGEFVTTRWTVFGTQHGPLPEMPPTGKTSTITGMSIGRFVEGKLVETWVNWDRSGHAPKSGGGPGPG